MSRQSEALLDSFRQFASPYDPDTIVSVMREQDLHPLADLFEALQDQVQELKVKLKRSESRTRFKRK